MKTLLLISGLCISNLLFPSDNFKELIEYKREEVLEYIHKFDEMKIAHDSNEMNIEETYWYMIGRFEAFDELLGYLDPLELSEMD